MGVSVSRCDQCGCDGDSPEPVRGRVGGRADGSPRRSGKAFSGPGRDVLTDKGRELNALAVACQRDPSNEAIKIRLLEESTKILMSGRRGLLRGWLQRQKSFQWAFDREDIEQAIAMAVFRCVKHYNSARGSFSSSLSFYILWALNGHGINLIHRIGTHEQKRSVTADAKKYRTARRKASAEAIENSNRPFQDFNLEELSFEEPQYSDAEWMSDKILRALHMDYSGVLKMRYGIGIEGPMSRSEIAAEHDESVKVVACRIERALKAARKIAPYV